MEFAAEAEEPKCPVDSSVKSEQCPMSGESGQTCPFARRPDAFELVHAATDLHQSIIDNVNR